MPRGRCGGRDQLQRRPYVLRNRQGNNIPPQNMQQPDGNRHQGQRRNRDQVPEAIEQPNQQHQHIAPQEQVNVEPVHHVDVPPTNVVADVQPEIERTGNVDLNILPIQDEPLLMPRFSDETDRFISMLLKEKVWNFEYVDLALFLV